MNEKRLDRLYPALTARERAILVLKAHHAGHVQEPQILNTMPRDQAPEFRRLIRLMNAVNVELALSLVLVRAQLRQTEIKLGWLTTIWMDAIRFSALAEYVTLHTKEPITESGLKARAAEIGEDLVGIDDAVLAIVERDPAAQDDDEAWERGWQAVEARVRAAIAAGALPAKGKGRRAKLRWADVEAWDGMEPVVFPDSGWEYDVYPDGAASKVERLLEQRAFALRIIRETPERLVIPHDEDGELRFEATGDKPSIALGLLEVIPQEVAAHWQEVRAVELGVERLGEAEFGGVDPLDPPGRAIVDDVRRAAEGICEGMRRFGVEVELPEPDAEDIDLVEKLVRRAAED